MKSRLIRLGALGLGVVLFTAALYYVNFTVAAGTVRRLGIALPLALLVSGLWHLARTWAWAWCFPQPGQVGFLRLARIRLAAEAFSYLTLRGIAGEPLKVILLADRVDARTATAAVALERLAYMVGTMFIVGAASVVAIAWLPLTRIWFRVFRAFAIAAAVVAILTLVVIGGRGTYLRTLLRRADRAFGTSASGGRIAGFLTAVEAQMLELVRGSRTRLLVLMTATVASYILMALEAWIVLRGAGESVTPVGAVAVETFSRVASFATAFIPANLGALEASSLAAVSAAGLAAGGAALAVARRLRGLFWAGLGLAIYPRKARPAPRAEHGTGPTDTRSRPLLLYIPHDPQLDVQPTARVAGLPIAERVIRSAVRAGYGRIVVDASRVTPDAARLLTRLAGALPAVIVTSTAQDWDEEVRAAARAGLCATLVGPGVVVSPALLDRAGRLEAAPGEALDVPAGAAWPVTGAVRVRAEDLPARDELPEWLRARDSRDAARPSGEDVSEGRAALALRIRRREDLVRAEAAIRRASYKDTDNTVAQFNRRMSLPISVALIRTPLTANQLSVALVALGFYSAWLFSLGHYWPGLLGAFLSLAASVLDGCDGEIARLKYQESALGCWIETFGDYSYYIAIFVGLTIGAVRQTGAPAFYWIGAAALGGTLLCFALLIYLRTRITAGRPERLHAIARDRFQAEPTLWSRLAWRLSFTATRSAMPYGIFLFALFHALPAIVVLAAVGANVYWISLVLKMKALVGEDAGELGLET